MSVCEMCGNSVDLKLVAEIAEEIFEQADRFGADSLQDNERQIYEGKLCDSCLLDAL